MINNTMMSLEGVIRENKEYKKPSHQPLPLVEPNTENPRADDGLVITSWIRAWSHRDQEERKMLRGHMETSFNNLLNIKAIIGR